LLMLLPTPRGCKYRFRWFGWMGWQQHSTEGRTDMTT
jgi:hypothetical protein